MRGAVAVATAAAALGLAACSDGGGGEGFTIALIEPDLTTVPLMAAADALREDGYEVDIVELAEPELAIEGLASGDYAISAEATSPALIAIEQGAPIKVIADVIGNQWAVYSQPEIGACADLDGQPVGIFSEGAVATAMVREWVAQECDGTEPEYLVIGGSDVRAQALLSGQITATALELSDVVALRESADADLHQLVDFGATLSELHPQTVYANADFLAEHGDAAQAFVDALVEVHEAVNADSGHLVELAEEYLDVEADDTLRAVAQEYVDRGLFDAAALTEERLAGTIEFFVAAGVVEDLTVEQVGDLSFIAPHS